MTQAMARIWKRDELGYHIRVIDFTNTLRTYDELVKEDDMKDWVYQIYLMYDVAHIVKSYDGRENK